MEHSNGSVMHANYPCRLVSCTFSTIPICPCSFTCNNVCIYMQTVTNTFQGILITDGTDTFAVFIYKCGGMEWGGGVIGWQAGPSHYASHKSSGDSDNYNIGCLYSTSYSAVVYKLSKYTCV